MRKLKFFTSLAIVSTLLFSTFSPSFSIVRAEETNIRPAYEPSELIVRFKDDKKDFKSQPSGVTIKAIPDWGLALAKVPEEKLEEYKESIATDENVEYVEYNYNLYTPLNLDNISNDPSSNWQWGLHNIGQTIEGSEGQIVKDVDINLPEAWKLIENKKEKLEEVIVAVLDSGVQTEHFDLKGSIWVNPGETAGDGIDNDGNGYIDDVHGWDFYSGKNTVVDNDTDGFHGTHLAGTIAAKANNQIGIAGIAANVKLMPLKFIHDNKAGSVWDAIEGIRYAEENGAKIVLASWGSNTYSPELEHAIKSSNMLFVAAAGNDKNDNDGAVKNYPASYDSENIISVGAVDKKGERAYFSNYGTKSVDIVAPGVSIFSTVPEDKYQYAEGTSMAAAHVAGVAALLAGVEKNISPVKIKEVLNLTGKTVTGAKNTASGKMVDARGALAHYLVSLPLIVDPIYDSSRYITGSTEPGAIVQVENKNNRSEIIAKDIETDEEGNFKFLLLKRLATNTELIIYSKKGLINSKEIEMKVLHDNVKPVLAEDLDITDKSEKLAGQVSEFAKIYIKIADKVFSGETDEDGSFSFDITEPFDIGTKGEYILTDLADPSNSTTVSFEVADHAKPTLSSDLIITDTTTTVTGKVSKQATVQLKVGNRLIHSKPVQTDKDGNFEINISKQKLGTKITVIMVDDRGQESEVELDVKDGIGPVISKLSKVYETSWFVEGYVNDSSKVTKISVQAGGKSWDLTEDELSIDDKNFFTIKLQSKLAINEKIKIVAEDERGNKSKETILTVQGDRTAPKLVGKVTVNEVEMTKITIDDKGDAVVKGTLSEEGTVSVLDGSSSSKEILVEKLKTDENGSFTVTIPKRQAKEKVTFVFVDTADRQNKSTVTVTVSDKTAPEFEEVSPVYNSSRVITGVLSEAGKVTATLESGKKFTSPTAKWVEGKGYVFTITMKDRQKEGTTIKLQAVDSIKQTSEEKPVTVLKDVTKPELEEAEALIITDAQTSVKGKVTKESTVQLFIGEQPLHKSPVKTDAAGNFRVTIKKQKAGTEITIKITDYAGNSGEPFVTTVKDDTKPVVSKVDTVYLTSKFITGKISEEAPVVTVKRNGEEIGTGKTDADGAFSIALKESMKLGIGDKLTIEAVDKIGLESKPKIVTVQKDTAAPKLELDSTIKVNNNQIIGYLNEPGIVAVSSLGYKTIGYEDTDLDSEDGKFTFTIDLDDWSLYKGQTITITAEDLIGNRKEYKFKVTQ